MRARLASFVLATAAAAAGAGVSAQPAQSRPVQIMPGDDVGRVRAENQRLRDENDRLRDALAQIDRANRRNKDRRSQRMIDRILDDARDVGDDDRRDDRDHRQQPQAQLMSQQDFATFLARVSGSNFESNRLDLVHAAAQANVFTSDQVVALMGATAFDDSRIDIAITLRSRVVDPDRFYLVFDALQFQSSRDTLRQRMGQ
ncbi:MAG TPA: DUF4476 domain-containing protein [Kofleriaceae bacterium]|jgi:hypothetical protein|nr:DUF4476 domain-containing protein [Kofleriaceae bacterium]